MNLLKKEFKNWGKIDYSWLFIANAIIIALSLYWGDSVLGIICGILGITANIFVSKQMILNYPFGIANVLIYAYISYNATLYGDATLNIFYYFPMNIIGWFMWLKAADKNDECIVEAKTMTNNQKIIVTIISIFSIVLYGLYLRTTDDVAPFLDSTSNILSIVAMILMVKQFTEQWYLWVSVNIVSIFMWFIALRSGTGDISMLIMWSVYLLNSIYGLICWKKASK